MAKIAALLPAYNEEKHIGSVLEALKQHLSPIIVVDDGSVDQTKAVAEAHGAIVLSRGYNMGYGQSVKDGLRWALDNGFDAVVTLDADGQHLPSEADRLIQKFEREHQHLVIGARDYRKIPLRRRIPNVLGKWMLWLAIGHSLPDNQSGYRLLDKALIPLVLNSKEQGFNFAVDTIILCLANAWEIGWVPISTIYSNEESHQNAWYQITGFTRMCIYAHRLLKKTKKNSGNRKLDSVD